MSWRDILGVNPSTRTPHAHNSQNTQKPTEAGNCADSADSAYRDSGQESSQLLESLADTCKGLDITVSEVRDALSDDDVADWRNGELTPETLRALARALVDRRLMDHGQPPLGYDQHANCRQCGPIWLWTTGTFDACPWCWNRIGERPIPRPGAVRCSDCAHYRRIDHPHLGHCAVGQPEAPAGLWDNDRRHCAHWLPWSG